MAATETKLGALHEKVADVLLEALDGEILPGYSDEESGEVVEDKRLPPSAAIIAAATKFLKDNAITCVPAENNALGELEAKMRERRNKRNSANLIDFADAREAAGRMNG